MLIMSVAAASILLCVASIVVGCGVEKQMRTRAAAQILVNLPMENDEGYGLWTYWYDVNDKWHFTNMHEVSDSILNKMGVSSGDFYIAYAPTGGGSLWHEGGDAPRPGRDTGRDLHEGLDTGKPIRQGGL